MAQADPGIRTHPIPQFRIQNEQQFQLPPLPEQRNLWIDDGDAPYRQLDFKVFYITNNGLLQLPVAASPFKRRTSSGLPGTNLPPTSNLINIQPVACRFVRAHAPFTRKIIAWIATRDGEVPDVPAPEDLSPDDRLLDYVIGVPFPMPCANGMDVRWSLSGTYTYGLRYAVNPPLDGLAVGSLPNVRGGANEARVDPMAFKDDLVGR